MYFCFRFSFANSSGHVVEGRTFLFILTPRTWLGVYCYIILTP
jgi:hypothetical protein